MSLLEEAEHVKLFHAGTTLDLDGNCIATGREDSTGMISDGEHFPKSNLLQMHRLTLKYCGLLE